MRIAVTNQKGGSGKTTTAVSLAAALGEQGQRVLLVDLDPQASASGWCGVRDGGSGLFELFANAEHFAATRGTEALVQLTFGPDPGTRREGARQRAWRGGHLQRGAQAAPAAVGLRASRLPAVARPADDLSPGRL